MGKTLRSHSASLHPGVYIWVIDQPRGQDGDILAKFFFCTQNKNEAYTPPSLSIKDLLHGNDGGKKNTKFAGKSQVNPSGQDRPILPARVANQNAVFTSSCQLPRVASHIIKMGSGEFNAGGNPAMD